MISLAHKNHTNESRSMMPSFDDAGENARFPLLVATSSVVCRFAQMTMTEATSRYGNMDATATLLQTSSPVRITDFSLVPSSRDAEIRVRRAKIARRAINDEHLLSDVYVDKSLFDCHRSDVCSLSRSLFAAHFRRLLSVRWQNEKTKHDGRISKTHSITRRKAHLGAGHNAP